MTEEKNNDEERFMDEYDIPDEEMAEFNSVSLIASLESIRVFNQNTYQTLKKIIKEKNSEQISSFIEETKDLYKRMEKKYRENAFASHELQKCLIEHSSEKKDYLVDFCNFLALFVAWEIRQDDIWQGFHSMPTYEQSAEIEAYKYYKNNKISENDMLLKRLKSSPEALNNHEKKILKRLLKKLTRHELEKRRQDKGLEELRMYSKPSAGGLIDDISAQNNKLIEELFRILSVTKITQENMSVIILDALETFNCSYTKKYSHKKYDNTNWKNKILPTQNTIKQSLKAIKKKIGELKTIKDYVPKVSNLSDTK
ncbi:MAG: hypothetical protein ACK4VI_02885 [Alphaproteobacteria bacterium]